MVSAVSTPPSQQHRLAYDGKTRGIRSVSAGGLCLSARAAVPPPPPPPPPATPEVNVFVLPAGGANEPKVGTPPALLIPIMLAGNRTSAVLTLDLGPTVAELKWYAAF